MTVTDSRDPMCPGAGIEPATEPHSGINVFRGREMSRAITAHSVVSVIFFPIYTLVIFYILHLVTVFL